MAPRKMQQIIAADPHYARTLGEGPVVRPARVATRALAPRLEERAPEPKANPTVNARPAAAEPPQVEASGPAAQRPDLTPPQAAPEVPAAVVPRQGSKRPKVRTERVAVWVRPLVRQMDRIEATGLPTQDVLKAAWRKTSARYSVGTSYVEPPPGERAESRDCCYATTLMLDVEPLAALARVHDRLGIKSRWSLIRGQVEPAFWAALDELLAELAEPGPA